MKVKFFTVNPFQENTYLLYDDSNEGVIIDPGFFTSTEKENVTSFLKEHNIKLQAVWLTHAHIDHILGLDFITSDFKTPVLMHEKEVEVYEKMSPMASQMYNIPLNLPTTPTQFFKEGDLISFGQQKLEVIFTPGHAPGHVVFVHHETGVIINGDVLFKGSIGRTDFPNSNHQDLVNSIQQKLFKLPDHYVVYTGHGEPTSIGEEKRNNPFVGIGGK